MDQNTEKSTAELVKEEIKSNLYLDEILKQGLVNYSSLVRKLLPKIQKKNKKANFQSVLIAIQRYYDENKQSGENIHKELLENSEIIAKNKIVTLAIERTKQAMKLINEVSKSIRWDLGDIMFFIQGSGEITIVIDKKNESKFMCLGKRIIEKKENLAIISLREIGNKIYSREIVGFLALLTSTLANNNINIYDIASTYKQTIFIVNETDLMKSYNSLDSLIKHYKE